jgi:hypothetical protein
MNLSFRLSNSWERFRDSCALSLARGGLSILIFLYILQPLRHYFSVIKFVPSIY